MLKKGITSLLAILLLAIVITPVSAQDYTRVDVGYKVKTTQWSDYAWGGALGGSEGSDALTALSLNLDSSPSGAGIEVRVYTVSGWSEWFQSFEEAGNGQAILGVQIQLTDFPHANVYYQSYRDNLGWGTWVSNGATSGNLSTENPVTGIRVKVSEVGIEYQSNVSGTLLQVRHNRETQGTGLIYTLKMGLISSDLEDKIEYRAYFKDSGWSNWVSNNTVLGSERAGSTINAIEARLVGLEGYHVGVQPQVEGVWWEYAYDGATAGALDKSLTAYRVEIVKDIQAVQTEIVVVEEEVQTPGDIGANPGITTLTYSAGNNAIIEYEDERAFMDYPELTIDGEFDDNPAGVDIDVNDQFTASLYTFNSGDQISVPDTFDGWGDNVVDDGQFEVFYGTYVNGVFTITSTRYELEDQTYTINPSLLNGATHTLILYDNDPSYIFGEEYRYTIIASSSEEYPSSVIINDQTFEVDENGYINGYQIYYDYQTDEIVVNSGEIFTALYLYSEGRNMILDGFVLSGVYYEQGWYVNTDVTDEYYMYYDITQEYTYDQTGYNSLIGE